MISDADLRGAKTVKAGIVAEAQAAHAHLPQYAGHWETDDWFLVVFTQEVETAMGGAFMKGDVTIARLDPEEADKAFPELTAYSRRNQIDTSVMAYDCEEF